MRRLLTLAVGIVMGGILMFIGFNYHVVVTDQSHYLIPKKKPQLTQAYVDIRDWGVEEWGKNPALAEAMIASGHGNLVQQSLQQGVLDELFRKIGVPAPASR